MIKALGITLFVIYVAGTWVYGVWYIWEHWAVYWAGDWSLGRLAFYAVVHAIIWPVWVVAWVV